MKPYTLPILFLSLFCANTTQASPPYNWDGPLGKNDCEIHATYGIVTLTNILAIMYWGTHNKLAPPTPQGTASVDFKYYLSNWFAMGCTGGVEFTKGDIQGDYSSPGYWKGKYTERIFTIAPEVTFIFAQKNRSVFYSTFAMGYSRIEKSFRFDQDSYNASFRNGVTSLPNGESTNTINTYICAGVRFGGAIGGFLQFGLGFKGLGSGGLSVRL